MSGKCVAVTLKAMSELNYSAQLPSACKSTSGQIPVYFEVASNASPAHYTSLEKQLNEYFCNHNTYDN